MSNIMKKAQYLWKDYRKNIIRVKKSTNYYLGKKCVDWLKICAILSFAFAVIVEFDIIEIHSHKFFLVTVLLGVSASLFVSFILLYIPFYIKKKYTVLSIKKMACEIFLEYDKLFNQLKLTPDGIRKDLTSINDADNVIISSESINNITVKIRKFNGLLDNSPFISEYINEISHMIEKNVLPSVELIDRLVEAVPEYLEKINQSNQILNKHIVLLCKCNNVVADIAEKYYPYNDICCVFRSAVEEVGLSVIHQNMHLAFNSDLITSFKATVQDVMIQNVKKEFLKLILLETDDILKQVND